MICIPDNEVIKIYSNSANFIEEIKIEEFLENVKPNDFIEEYIVFAKNKNKDFNTIVSNIIKNFQYIEIFDSEYEEPDKIAVDYFNSNILPTYKVKDAIDEIVRFQKERGLDKKEFSIENEMTNIIEELLEANGYIVDDRDKLKSILSSNFKVFNIFKKKEDFNDTDIVDAFGDIIVFCIGAIMKLGYNPKCVLSEISKEINSRGGEFKNGKFIKFKNYPTYKARLNNCKNK